MEDFNHLLKCEQIELMKARASDCATARSSHHGRADGYARQIRAHRHPYRSGAAESGTRFAPWPFGGEGRPS